MKILVSNITIVTYEKKPEALDEKEWKLQIEYAINTACSQLEQIGLDVTYELKHKQI